MNTKTLKQFGLSTIIFCSAMGAMAPQPSFGMGKKKSKPTVAPAASPYRTTQGAVFERVEVKGAPLAWKAPDGLIWASVDGEYSNANSKGDVGVVRDKSGQIVATLTYDTPALRVCELFGGSLPRMAHVNRLKTYFEHGEGFIDLSSAMLTDIGRKDLTAMFPDATGYFWTRDINNNLSGVKEGDEVFGYYLPSGFVVSTNSHQKHSVICVLKQN